MCKQSAMFDTGGASPDARFQLCCSPVPACLPPSGIPACLFVDASAIWGGRVFPVSFSLMSLTVHCFRILGRSWRNVFRFAVCFTLGCSWCCRCGACVKLCVMVHVVLIEIDRFVLLV